MPSRAQSRQTPPVIENGILICSDWKLLNLLRILLSHTHEDCDDDDEKHHEHDGHPTGNALPSSDILGYKDN